MVIQFDFCVGSGDVDDAVSINIKRDLNLGDAPWGGRNAGEFEFAEEVVVLCARTFALIHLNKYSRLVIGVGRENLRLFGGQGRVALDEGGS